MLIGRVLSLVVVMICASPSDAVDSDHTRTSLKGLAGVHVLVEHFDDERKRAGFDRRTFQTDVELKLRMAGIKVLSEKEHFSVSGMPTLTVNVTPLHKEPAKHASYAVQLQLSQWVRLVREPSLGRLRGVTWSHGGVGIGPIPFVREDVKDMTDQFINAWLSVNPKK